MKEIVKYYFLFFKNIFYFVAFKKIME